MTLTPQMKARLKNRPLPTSLEGALAELRALPGRLAEEVEAINADPELWPEAKEARIGEAREEAQRRRDRLNQVVQAEREDAGHYLREQRARRQPEPVALDRVRRLLNERRSAPDAVLEHAATVGDPELVVALSAELQDSLLERRPDGVRPDPQQRQAVERLLLGCDAVYVELTGDEKLRKALELHLDSEAAEFVQRFALQGTEGADLGTTSRARLAMAHATGSTKETEEQRQEREAELEKRSPKQPGVLLAQPSGEPGAVEGGVRRSR